MERYLDIGGTRYLLEQLHDIMEKMLVGDVDLSDYVTKTELQKILDELNIDIDLSNYVTKEELEDALADIDTSNIDLSAYATKEYVTDAINNAELGGDGSSVDLSIYAKKTDLDAKAEKEHTHTMSDITDYEEPDLSSYAKKTDIPSLSGYATKTYVDQNKFSGSYNDLTDKPTIPSIDGLATTEYVDNAVANIPTGGNVDLSNYYTKTEVDTAISNVGGKSAYEVYLDNREYRYVRFDEIIAPEDDLYVKVETADDELGTVSTYELSNCHIRCNYERVASMLNALLNAGYNNKIIVAYNANPTSNIMIDCVPEPTDEDKETHNTLRIVPYVDLVYCGDSSSISYGSYWYRFVKHYIYDEELGGNVEMWVPYLVYVNKEGDIVYTLSYYESVYTKTGNTYNVFTGIRTMTADKVKRVISSFHPTTSLSSDYKTKIHQIYLQFFFYLKHLYITQEEWLESLKGEDGSVSFENLTDAQKAELKGDKGDKGDTGKDGTDGRGILSTTYEYGSSGNTATKPTEWYTTVGEVPTNYYRWTKQTVLYTDETSDIGYFVTKVVDSSEGDYATKEELVNYYTKSEVDTLIPNVSDGEDGTDGVTPHIDEITKHWFIGETDTGVLAEGINGVDGTNGQDGADGYTPVRGTDYWTEQDIQTIKDYIDTELGVIENGSY